MSILDKLLITVTRYKMMLKIVLLLSCVALAISEPEGKCPDTTSENPVYLPDTVDCAVFYECDHGDPIELKCAPGTYFNEKNSLCEIPSLVDCGSRSTTLATTTPPPS
ncbi:unnamed protein product [Diabrotica balteata]|uniref:Chitin-binding type-2 domain-containing protein n=1 Tax=Diabrotica balteata TaxID=107213 RepID=A0A9N9XBI1_DIABA|nr:unnamed protein product [Diabrotica balteata]